MPRAGLTTLISCAAVVLILVTAISRAENWPQCGGAKLDGISSEKDVPTKWSRNEGVLWRVPLPGPAGATPAVWGERIFLTSVSGEQKADLMLLCVSTDG